MREDESVFARVRSPAFRRRRTAVARASNLGVIAVRCRRAAFDHYPIQERRQDSLYGDQGTRQRSDLRMPVGGLLVRFARWLIIHPLAASSSPRRFRRVGEGPKTVKLFVNTVAMGFDSASSTPAAQAI